VLYFSDVSLSLLFSLGLSTFLVGFIFFLKTLDGEMQKLVYDNYNKFITATETIKEMKKDVYSMDSDMDSVR
jgi:hypothetical protein